jgi:hypothetical protein
MSKSQSRSRSKTQTSSTTLCFSFLTSPDINASFSSTNAFLTLVTGPQPISPCRTRGNHSRNSRPDSPCRAIHAHMLVQCIYNSPHIPNTSLLHAGYIHRRVQNDQAAAGGGQRSQAIHLHWCPGPHERMRENELVDQDTRIAAQNDSDVALESIAYTRNIITQTAARGWQNAARENPCRGHSFISGRNPLTPIHKLPQHVWNVQHTGSTSPARHT